MDFAGTYLKWLSHTTSFWGELSASGDSKNLGEYLRLSDLSGLWDTFANQATGAAETDTAPYLLKWADKNLVEEEDGTHAFEYDPPDGLGAPSILIVGGETPRVLVTGLQFRATPSNGGKVLLSFEDHPAALMPERKAVALYHHDIRRNIRSSWFDMPPCSFPGASAILHYARGTVSSHALAAAAAAAAGEKVFMQPLTVTAFQPSGTGKTTLYLSNGETVDAPDTSEYAYERAEVPAGTVLSENVKVRIASGNTPRWWREGDAAWTPGGISLNSLDESGTDPYSDALSAPDRMARAWVVSSDAGDVDGEKSHVRFELDGTTADADQFFSRMHARETETERYLNATLKLPKSGKSTMLNPVDLLFNYCYGFKSVVLDVSPDVARLYDCLDFFRENIPLGHTPFVSFGGGLSSAVAAEDELFIFDPETGEWHSRSLESFS